MKAARAKVRRVNVHFILGRRWVRIRLDVLFG